MDEKRKALSTFIIFARRVKQKEEGKESPVKAVLKIVPSTKELYSEIERAKMLFEKAMDDDFNTPIALACLFEIVRSCNKVLYDISYTDEYLPVFNLCKTNDSKVWEYVWIIF